ncbi:cyclin-dependent kinase inhibitor 7-like isoform X2 [Rutidosis leptorrhynchoides]|uniref:cyclin-dependent kinase inhibitor 7-like isoform X2 n=1 Tax=Rutidosis leptorrhynchoides TaxID=125765 RepID=UPI003A99373C
MDHVTLCRVIARGRDMAKETEEIADNLGTVKRRKLNSENFKSTFVETNCANSMTADEITDSCNGVVDQATTEKHKASDLEGESVATDTAERNKLDGSERPSELIELKSESEELEIITGKQSPVKKKMPPEAEAELEEFFAAAQQDLHKRFMDKYNYDILNDIPLKGRFEWIQVKQGKK